MTREFAFAFGRALLATLAVLALAGYAVAALWVREPLDRYRASTFEFDLARGWWCEQDGSEIVCHHGNPPSKSVIAIIAQKYRNAEDNLDAYEAHLRAPKANTVNGDGALSKVVYVKRRMLGAREWVEALHEGSELRNFQTYYFGTATSHVGILMTVSVHRPEAARYIGDAELMLSSLRAHQR